MRDLDALRMHARALPSDTSPDATFVDRLAEGRVVLLGEASHGTHDFYAFRAEVTRRLITDHGFSAVAIEGDWPDVARVDAYVRGRSEADDADGALGGFTRFPRWMWRNHVTRDFIAWLHEHADSNTAHKPPRFFGLDLYNLHGSIESVLEHLDRTDPAAAERARLRYACFDHTGIDGQRYGYSTLRGRDDCEDAVVEQLVELQRQAAVDAGTHDDAEDRFDALGNARLVADAEGYYRAMYRGRNESWNLRDRHMADTLDSVLEHLERTGREPRVVVWAHNSHLGDARATEMGRRGELNLGQLCRERYGDEAVLVGQTTHSGEVSAASDWGGAVERKGVRDSLHGSYERLFHDVGRDRFWLDLHEPEVADAVRDPRLERAIGVIYRPETERISHYFLASLPQQFDVVVHLDRTDALEPLDLSAGWQEGEVPDTYPWAV